jgi:hypothetical protein
MTGQAVSTSAEVKLAPGTVVTVQPSKSLHGLQSRTYLRGAGSGELWSPPTLDDSVAVQMIEERYGVALAPTSKPRCWKAVVR